MQELVGRLTALDPDASEALKVVAYFDALTASGVSLDGLLRSNLKDRAEIYAKLVQNGLKTRNECRQLENDPPVPGGDELTAQTNLAPLKMLGTMQGAGNAGTSDAIAQ